MKLREIYKSANYYSVYECDHTARLLIAVVVGSVAMYEVFVELLPNEAVRLQNEGQLDSLARDIRDKASAYQDRTLIQNPRKP